eukprot:CAMPEP_0197518342 /NCGR_PEP_ID=MMETSP1318-20131121/3516_1 /TAXON_ID=552666 /ORGANISM="Partenskyella glossopodia, Strain RCC365" /LENGTH=564 /DNA_ID=CAMNT_0043068611 /DNA_START=54 /DNA_END=1748 /DNA_ORIENTATION=+
MDLQSQMADICQKYKGLEIEQTNLLKLVFRKIQAKAKTASMYQINEQTRDLIEALKMEIQFRRQLKAQTLHVMERILIQGLEDSQTLQEELKRLNNWRKHVKEKQSKSKSLQEINGVNPKILDVYDWVIDIEYLSDLAKNGWKVERSKKFLTEQTLKIDDWNGAIIAVVGLYDKGKTFLLNQITGANLPSGRKVRTKGLSFKHMEVDGMKFCLLDSAGSNTPVRVENEFSVYQKEVTEHFILDIIFEVSDYFICVVNDFTSLDQRYLDKLARSLQKSNKSFREVVVVHNFKGVTSSDALEHAWNTQVTQVYRNGGGGTRRTRVAAMNPVNNQLEDKTVTWFKTRYSRHLCLANATSSLGMAINPWAVSLLRYWLKSVVIPPSRTLTLQDTIVSHCSRKLSVCFKSNQPQNNQLKVYETEDQSVSYIRPSNPEHKKRFCTPKLALYGSSVVLERPDSFKPNVTVYKDSKSFVIEFDAPGIHPEAIELKRQGHTTIISGRRGDPFKDQKNVVLEKQERLYGSFSVAVNVPPNYLKKWNKCSVKDGVFQIKFLADIEENEITLGVAG